MLPPPANPVAIHGTPTDDTFLRVREKHTQRPEMPHPGPPPSHDDAGKMPAVQWAMPTIRRIGRRAEYMQKKPPRRIARINHHAP